MSDNSIVILCSVFSFKRFYVDNKFITEFLTGSLQQFYTYLIYRDKLKLILKTDTVGGYVMNIFCCLFLGWQAVCAANLPAGRVGKMTAPHWSRENRAKTVLI